MGSQAVRDSIVETRRKAEGLALVVRGFLNLRSEPPCSVCRMNGVDCALCRLHRAASAALAEWERK
jgi:hypothetical protein